MRGEEGGEGTSGARTRALNEILRGTEVALRLASPSPPAPPGGSLPEFCARRPRSPNGRGGWAARGGRSRPMGCAGVGGASGGGRVPSPSHHHSRRNPAVLRSSWSPSLPRRSLTPPPNVNEPRSEEILTSFLRPPRVRLPHEHLQRRINSNFGGPSSIIVEGIKEDNVEETMGATGAKVARKEID